MIFSTNNPDVTLPEERIKPVARADKSGTTEIFTRALSSFSNAWKNKYGVFSVGLNSDKTPIKWDSAVIKNFGKRIYGVTDEIKDVKYSIGYTSVSQADQYKLGKAYIINKYGNTVGASTTSVQASMDDLADTMTSRLTADLADAPGPDSYPLSGYTYIILKMKQASNCTKFTELVRFLDWVLTDDQPRQDCELHKMVPITSKLVTKIQVDVLKKLECNGDNIYALMEAQKKAEEDSLQTWRLPVSIVSAIAGIAVIVLVSYLIYQRVKFNKMMNSDDWLIPIDDITFCFPSKGKDKGLFSSNMSVSEFTTNSNGSDEISVNAVLQWPAKWNGLTIGLKLLDLDNFIIDRPTKRILLSIRDNIVHENVLRFYGLAMFDENKFIISDYCAKGALYDILQDNKFNLSENMKMTMAIDVASGLNFLHYRNIVHGNLKSSTCLLDNRWTVKLSDWETTKMCLITHAKQQNNSKNIFQTRKTKYESDQGEYAAFFADFWIAPEILRSEHKMSPSNQTDIYSYAIVVQEIFSREDPYTELSDTVSPKEIINAIKTNHLRPEIRDNTPVKFRQVMEIAWSDDPTTRPSTEQVCKWSFF